jgi:predicted Zn-dependent protease
MPQEWDSKLGDPIRRSVLHQKEACTGAAGQEAIDQLGARLQPPTITTLPLTIDVVQVEDINAFALPGNHIIVFSGLIAKAETPEMLAGVLAHEMGHLEMRHPTRGVIEQLGLAAAINLLAGNNAISNLGQVMAGLSYTRDMERQADERAIALLRRADIRADGLAGFFAVLKREEKLHLPALLSDHPGLDDRVSATQQDASGGPAMSAAAWQAIKSMCGSAK